MRVWRWLLLAAALAALYAGYAHRTGSPRHAGPLHPKRVAEVGTSCRTWASPELHVKAGNFRIRAGCGWSGRPGRWAEPRLVPTEVRDGWRFTWQRGGRRWHRDAVAIGYTWTYHASRCVGNECDSSFGELYGIFRDDGRFTLWGPTEID